MRAFVGCLVATASVLLMPSAATAQSTLVNTIDTSQLAPPSPDSSGLAYQASTDRLLMCDSEVTEVPVYVGVNVWEMTPAGVVLASSETAAFSSEPTGVAYNPSNGHWFFSDDDANRVFEVDLGPDGMLNTADDLITEFKTSTFGSGDAQGIAFDTLQGHLFIADGEAAEIFEVSPGLNGVFDGIAPGGDDGVVHFDTASLGLLDPEGVEYNADDDTLFILDRNTRTVGHATRNGLLISTIDLGFLNMLNPAGITYAPGSVDPGVKNLYIADRGVDNGEDPNENDGKIYEITLPSDDPGRYDVRVASGTDDAEERPTGAVSLTSSDLDLVFDETSSSDQTIGIRFTEVGVPPQAVIANAHIRFTANEVDSIATSLTIQGQADDDASTFTSTDLDISSRPLTVASTVWLPPAWDVVGEQGPDQQTPDLSSVLQEIVDRPGWQICNSLALIVTGSGERVAEAYDGQVRRPPLLHIDYDPAACVDTDADGRTICHCDCDDTNDQLWFIPGEARVLMFDADKQTLSWEAPQQPGGPAPFYDTVRSDVPSDFVSSVVCVETGDASDRSAMDVEQPTSGVVFHYLIRALNDCGAGLVGRDSAGIERAALSCP